jgi:hypothetical protein
MRDRRSDISCANHPSTLQSSVETRVTASAELTSLAVAVSVTWTPPDGNQLPEERRTARLNLITAIVSLVVALITVATVYPWLRRSGPLL